MLYASAEGYDGWAKTREADGHTFENDDNSLVFEPNVRYRFKVENIGFDSWRIITVFNGRQMLHIRSDLFDRIFIRIRRIW